MIYCQAVPLESRLITGLSLAHLLLSFGRDLTNRDASWLWLFGSLYEAVSSRAAMAFQKLENRMLARTMPL